MDRVNILVICALIEIIIFGLTLAQNKATQKCNEYKLFKSRPQSRKHIGINIVGGNFAKINEFQHMVALGFGKRDDLRWFCGGALISPNYVLTAAHCTNNQEFGPVQAMRFGTKSLKNGGTVIGVERIIKHPNYKPPSQYNDIALLKLKTAVDFSDAVLPACLNTVKNIQSNSQLIATGWGKLSFAGPSPEELMKVELKLYNNRQCNASYKNSSKRKLANGIVDRTQICAGGGKGEEKDTCQGDSGGPLVIRNGNVFTVVGVTSFGKACGVSNIPGVYTKVSAFVPWIEKIVWP